MTVTDLEKATGIQWRTIYRHLNGETTMNLVQAAAYANALGVPLEELLEAVA